MPSLRQHYQWTAISSNQQETMMNPNTPMTLNPLFPDAPFASSTAPVALDGLANLASLHAVIVRVAAASTVFAIASSIFTAALVAASHINIFPLGPIETAILNAACITYFVSIMLPVALLLAWLFRYKKEKPYQKCELTIGLPFPDALHVALAAALAVPGAELVQCDEIRGLIICNVQKQELIVKLHEQSPQKTAAAFVSHARINALEFLLFGYTLAVDNNAARRNLEIFLRFLKNTDPNVWNYHVDTSLLESTP
jgi:hypothetical protein